MISNPLKVLWSFCLLVFLLTTCRPTDPFEDVKISIDLNIFKTFVSFRFADAETGELIGKADGTIVKLSFGGRDAVAVVSQTGERIDQHTSVLGMISVALDPYGPYQMIPGHSIIFSFVASASGYMPTKAAINLSKEGTHVFIVSMRKTGYPENKPQQYLVKPGEVIDGTLPVGFRMITPGNLELDFPDSVQFAGTSGDRASGRLSITAIRYNRLSETSAGGTRVMRFSNQGVINPGILEPESILDLSLQGASTGLITQLPGKPISWRFTVNSDYQAGDSLPAWSFDPVQKIWGSAGYAKIMTEDTSRFATLPLNHFSLYASGNVIPTRLVSGEISFSIDKPFPTSSFPGIITIADANSGERIQTFPVTLFSGLSVPLTLDLPIGSSVILTVQAIDSDYEFATQPVSLSIPPDQLTFSGSFKLIPLKCRLSGIVTASFPADFTGYPVPAILMVTDGASGNVLLSISVPIKSPVFSTSFSTMVRDNRPVDIRLVPATLSGDFRSIPILIREESPCVENGSWNFALDPNTCLIQSTISIAIKGTVPREPVPAEILLLRASDRQLIKIMAVSLNPTITTINLESAVPKNTTLLVVLIPTYSNRLFTSDPAEFLWDNPCSNSLNPVFTVTPEYAQLSGKIVFSFDPGLLLDEIPVRILTYTLQNDRLLSSQDYNVHRSDPMIPINQFTPIEPLYLKITRASSSVRFNPVPFKIQIPDPSNTPENWMVTLNPTQLLPVHFLVKVECPKGDVLPTVQGYYRIPGEDWHEMNIISGNLTITIELGLTYEVGMILSGVMIDSIFTVDKQENELTFDLAPSDCEKMGWGK